MDRKPSQFNTQTPCGRLCTARMGINRRSRWGGVQEISAIRLLPQAPSYAADGSPVVGWQPSHGRKLVQRRVKSCSVSIYDAYCPPQREEFGPHGKSPISAETKTRLDLYNQTKSESSVSLDLYVTPRDGIIPRGREVERWGGVSSVFCSFTP